MGCICSKATRANVFAKHNAPTKETKKIGKHSISNSSNEDEVVIEVDGPGNDTLATLPKVSRLLSLAAGERGSAIVTGWPPWLTAVAGEAINGWVPRRADSFEKLDKVGQGTYSSVYKARDLETNKIVALKKVRFATMDPESVRFMAREIIILRRLDHPNVMKLEGIITSKMSTSLYLIFEYMEHDLAGLLATPGIKFTEPQIKCYMKQLLNGLEHCHSRGVLHRDIKGSNLLINQEGNLKIADFGLATVFDPPQKQPLTSRVVTLWYRPPELLLGATSYGVYVDLWSSGCILAELFAGKPIMPGRTEVEQLHKIFKLCGSPSEEYWKRSKLPHATIFKPQRPYKRCVAETFKDFPSSALALLDVLLAVEPEDRKTAISALNSEFFTESPLPCDPSSLPKYPPSKEFDVKLRDEDARKRTGFGGKSRKTAKGSKAIPAPDTNVELAAQKPQWQSDPKSINEKSNPTEEGTSRNVYRHPTSYTSAHGNQNEAVKGCVQSSTYSKNSKELKNRRSFIQQGAAQWSIFSSSVVVRGKSQMDSTSSTTSINPHYDSSHHFLNGQKFSDKEDRSAFQKKGRMHYSGPLMPAGGNIDEMLKEHEKHIQQAVRKARIDKT